MSPELVSLVNEADEVIGVKPRADLIKSDIVRISGLWIENSKGQVLLAQRSFKKKIGPGQWGPAAAGTVESDETYLSNIIKEAEEEIGLTGFTPTVVGKRTLLESDGNYGRIITFFKAVVDKTIQDFTFDREEVAAIKWVNKQSVLADVKAHPAKYTPSAFLWEELFY